MFEARAGVIDLRAVRAPSKAVSSHRIPKGPRVEGNYCELFCDWGVQKSVIPMRNQVWLRAEFPDSIAKL